MEKRRFQWCNIVRRQVLLFFSESSSRKRIQTTLFWDSTIYVSLIYKLPPQHFFRMIMFSNFMFRLLRFSNLDQGFFKVFQFFDKEVIVQF